MADVDAKNIKFSLAQFCLAIGYVVTSVWMLATMDGKLNSLVAGKQEDRTRFEKSQEEANLRMQKMELDMADMRVRVGVMESKLQKIQDAK